MLMLCLLPITISITIRFRINIIINTAIIISVRDNNTRTYNNIIMINISKLLCYWPI